MTEDENDTARRWAEWLRDRLQGRPQKWLVDATDGRVSKALVSDWLAGKYRPNPENAVLVAEAFGADPREVLLIAGHEVIAETMPGGEPAEEEEEDGPPYSDPLEREIWKVTEMPEAERRAFIQMFRARRQHLDPDRSVS